MSNTSREQILSAIRANIPPGPIEHPRIPVFSRADEPLKLIFERHLEKAAGAAYNIANRAEAQAKLASLHPEAKVICSTVPEISGTRRAETIRDPHELADVDVGVVRAQFGVAETGAVWLTQEDLIVNSLGFLSQHLVVLLDPNEIVADMHEAYARVHLDRTAYGCFMVGPSATGDIEATMVRGAQGARSLSVFFMAKTSSVAGG
ncbi:MAG TPA: LUD domain-containing protein [Bryobacteraceae bacterium]|nr:LUD domain-containing protein [Bryobacteraceae bacterium]